MRVARGGVTSHVITLGLSGVGVYAAASLGYGFILRPAGAAVVWPPAGFLLAILLLSNRSTWPAAILGALVGNVGADLVHGSKPFVALAAGSVNSLESVAAAFVVSRVVPGPVRLDSLRQLNALVVGGAILSNALTSVLGAFVLMRGSHMPFPKAWFVWWIGDGLGMLIVTPALLTMASLLRPRKLPWTWTLECLVLFAGIFAAARLLLDGDAHGLGFQETDPYMIVPLLFWAAIRFGPAGSAVATLCVAGFALWNGAQGRGPFVGAAKSSTESVFELYAYLTITSLSSLVTAVMLRERQKAQEQLLDSEARFRRIAETITEVFWIADVGLTRIDYVSPTYEVVWARSRESLYRNPRSFLHDVHPEDRNRVLETLRRNASFEHEYRIVRPDGTVRWIFDRGAAVADSSGTIVQYVGAAQDITERRQAEQHVRDVEERMRFALNAAGVGIWEVNLEESKAYWSDVCERLHGLAPGSFDKTFEAFVACAHPEDRSHLLATVERSIADGTEPSLEYRSIWPDGSVHHIQSIGRFFYDESGRPLRGAGIAVDITDRRALENQLRQSQKMEAVGQLAGGVAHDFNNLLTAILGYANLLADDARRSGGRETEISEIVRAAERASRLTQQLLAFSRKQVLAPRVLRIGTIVSDLAPMLQRLLGATVDLRTVIGDSGAVRADAGQLEQVLVNLAVNARDAMRDGGQLTLETADVRLNEEYALSHTGVLPGSYVLLAVSDNGHGMPPETQARVFEPFFTTKPKGQGTGLGLAVVHGIVKQSGGHIWLYSEKGQGTTFKIYLPRTDAEVELKKAEVAPPNSAGSETVMLVEDEPSVREFVHKVLSRKGYRVQGFSEPEDAIEFARSSPERIDVLLTDVVLPGMSGPDLAGAIKDIRPDTKILFMSGYTEGAITHQALLDPGVAFLQKPFSPTSLVQQIRELIDAHAVA